jgi:hypothetical protein
LAAGTVSRTVVRGVVATVFALDEPTVNARARTATSGEIERRPAIRERYAMHAAKQEHAVRRGNPRR